MEVRITKVRVRSDLPGCKDTEDSYFVLSNFCSLWEGSEIWVKKKYPVNWSVRSHLPLLFPWPMYIPLTLMIFLLKESWPVLFTALSPRTQNSAWQVGGTLTSGA